MYCFQHGRWGQCEQEERMFFWKSFSTFEEGLSELKNSCMAIAASLERAHNQVKLSDEYRSLLIPMGLAFSVSYEMVVKFLLLHQASQAPFGCQKIYARANCRGFVYRTNSGFFFGWRKTKKSYRFVVTLGHPERHSWIRETEERLKTLGWQSSKRNPQPSLNLSN